MMRLSSYDGNPFIGVYCAANESFSFVPLDSSDTLIDDITESLHVDVLKTTIAGANILGSLMAVNSYGVVVSSLASEREIELITECVPASRLDDRLNAAGNNILVNDNAALVNPRLGNKAVKELERVLQVEVTQAPVAGINTVGSACVVTNKGLLCHPNTSEEELRMLSSLFKVPSSIGTLNYGTALVGACMIANSKGAAVGSRSTPIELGRVEDSLGLT
jgi:translation initiation factor 6